MAHELASLFTSHAGEIRAGLRRRGALPELAEDLTQDTFLRYLVAGAAPQQPRAYLWRIALNLLSDHRRRDRLVDWIALTEEAYDSIAAVCPLPEEVLGHRQRLILTAAALMEMPEPARRAFMLCRVEGKTIDQAAAAMEASPSRVWRLVRDAFVLIRRKLEETP